MPKPRTMKKLTMIREKRGRSHHAKREFPKLLFPRWESNEEIMHRSALTRGYVRIRFQPYIKHPDTGTYAGYHGGALTVDLPTAREAKLFVEQAKMAIRRLVQDFNERPTRQKGEHTTPLAL